MKSFYKQCGVSPEGLVLCLDQSDPRSYGDLANWYDLSPYANHGVQATAGNQPVIGGIAGLSGTGRTFDGSTDFINCGNKASLDVTDGITIAAWIKVGNATPGFIVSKAYKYSNYAYRFYSTSATGITFDVWTPDRAFVSALINENQWNLVIGTYNGTQLKLDINGVLKASANQSGDIHINTFSVLIGAGNDNSPTSFFDFLHGSIGQVLIYNRGLNLGERQALFNATRRKYEI